MADREEGGQRTPAGEAERGGETPNGEPERVRPRNPLQWAVAGLSAALIGAALVFLASEAVGPTAPPEIVVRADSVREAGGLYYLPLTLRNRGDESVQALQLSVGLERGGAAVEEARLTLDWLPGRSKREAAAVFRQDPRGYRVVIRVEGYARP